VQLSINDASVARTPSAGADPNDFNDLVFVQVFKPS